MEAAIASGAALGLERVEDVNEPGHDGGKIGYTIRLISKGRRQSAAVSFSGRCSSARIWWSAPGCLPTASSSKGHARWRSSAAKARSARASTAGA